MGLFGKKAKTMQDLLETDKEFRQYIEQTMYQLWYRGTLAQGDDALDNFINLLYSNYEGNVQPSQMAHIIINMGGQNNG